MTMAVPTVIGQLIVLFYNLADTFFIGRTGNPYMVAGASLILPVFNIASALAAIVGLGGGTLISRLLGRNEREEASRVSSFTFYAAALIGLCWAVFTLLFMNRILTLLGAVLFFYGVRERDLSEDGIRGRDVISSWGMVLFFVVSAGMLLVG